MFGDRRKYDSVNSEIVAPLWNAANGAKIGDEPIKPNSILPWFKRVLSNPDLAWATDYSLNTFGNGSIGLNPFVSAARGVADEELFEAARLTVENHVFQKSSVGNHEVAARDCLNEFAIRCPAQRKLEMFDLLEGSGVLEDVLPSADQPRTKAKFFRAIMEGVATETALARLRRSKTWSRILESAHRNLFLEFIADGDDRLLEAA